MNKQSVVHLKNPWSGHESSMTWGDVVKWAKNHVHQDDLPLWMKEARAAARAEDARALGAMIIGS